MTSTIFLNITMSAFVIGETTNNKNYSTQLKTHVWIVSSRNVLTGCESEASDCLCKVGITPLYRNRLCPSQHCRLLFQVQETVLCTHSNICIVLLWNSVVNTTEPLISSCVLFCKPKLSSLSKITSGILSKHNPLVTLQRERKTKSHHMTTLRDVLTLTQVSYVLFLFFI